MLDFLSAPAFCLPIWITTSSCGVENLLAGHMPQAVAMRVDCGSGRRATVLRNHFNKDHRMVMEVFGSAEEQASLDCFPSNLMLAS